MRKINIDTDIRLAMTAAVRLGDAIAATRQLCSERYEQFGAAGHGRDIRPMSLGDMARRYVSGELDPRNAEAAGTMA